MFSCLKCKVASVSESLGCYLLNSYIWFHKLFLSFLSYKSFVKMHCTDRIACSVPSSVLLGAGITALKQKVQVLMAVIECEVCWSKGKRDNEQTCLSVVGKC